MIQKNLQTEPQESLDVRSSRKFELLLKEHSRQIEVLIRKYSRELDQCIEAFRANCEKVK